MNWQNLLQYVVEGIVLFIVGLFLYKIKTKKPNLVNYITNISFFHIPGQPPISVGTHTITIQNMGRGKAEEIEVHHNQLPFINVFPDIQFQIEETPQGGKILKFNNLLPKKKIIISYLYTYTQNPTVFLPTYVKSKEANAKLIKTIHTPIYPKWLQYLAAILMLLGSIFLLNLTYELIKLII